MKKRWLPTLSVALLLCVIMSSTGMANKNQRVIGAGEQQFKDGSNIQLTPVQAIKRTEAASGTTLGKDKAGHLVEKQMYLHELMRLKDYAWQKGNTVLAKEIQQSYYELQIERHNDHHELSTSKNSNPELITSEDNSDQDAYLKQLQQLISDYREQLPEDDDVSFAKPEKDVSVQSAGNVLLLGQALDISFPAGYMAIFEFTTGQSGEYRYFTGNHGGTGGPNDTVLYLFADEALTQLIASNDDANGTSFSEIKTALSSNTTVYLVLAGYNNGAVNARLSSAFTTFPASLTGHLDVNLPASSTQTAVFTPSVYGTYTLSTGHYGGNTANGSNDTVLYVYSDSAMTNLIAYNDDSGGTTFSQVTLNLMPGRSYYIKLQAFGGGAVYTRLAVSQATTVFSTLQAGIELSVSRIVATPEFIRFTPGTSGTYRFTTSPFGGTGPANDTFLELFDSASLTNSIHSNDNAGGTVFSQFHLALNGGTDYYVVLREKNGGAVHANLSVQEINPLPTVSSISGPNTVVYEDQGSFELYAYDVEDQATGVASVKFETWTASGGQDDVYWHEGTNLGNGTWRADISYAQHLDEVGSYITNVYVVTNGNHQEMVGSLTTQVKVQGEVEYFYDTNGVLDYALLPNGQQLNYEYDANGNLLRTRLQHP